MALHLGMLSNHWACSQTELFPWLAEEIGPLSERYQRFIMVLELVRVEAYLSYPHGQPGCPPRDRAALAFLTKSVFNIGTTRILMDRLATDKTLRFLCGWSGVGEVPGESTFSRALAEFAASALPIRLHEALIANTQPDRLRCSGFGRSIGPWFVQARGALRKELTAYLRTRRTRRHSRRRLDGAGRLRNMVWTAEQLTALPNQLRRTLT